MKERKEVLMHMKDNIFDLPTIELRFPDDDMREVKASLGEGLALLPSLDSGNFILKMRNILQSVERGISLEKMPASDKVLMLFYTTGNLKMRVQDKKVSYNVPLYITHSNVSISSSYPDLLFLVKELSMRIFDNRVDDQKLYTKMYSAINGVKTSGLSIPKNRKIFVKIFNSSSSNINIVTGTTLDFMKYLSAKEKGDVNEFYPIYLDNCFMYKNNKSEINVIHELSKNCRKVTKNVAKSVESRLNQESIHEVVKSEVVKSEVNKPEIINKEENRETKPITTTISSVKENVKVKESRSKNGVKSK